MRWTLERSAKEVKSIAVFAGEGYYPIGGWDDLVASFDTADEAKQWIEAQERVIPLGDDTEEAEFEYQTRRMEWWQIVNLKTGVIVARSNGGA